jgi:hypothetical protein
LEARLAGASWTFSEISRITLDNKTIYLVFGNLPFGWVKVIIRIPLWKGGDVRIPVIEWNSFPKIRRRL